MTTATFTHYDLELVSPSFESKLNRLVIDLDHLRQKRLGGTTHPEVFFELKDIFHSLESIASARIEGNQTTIAEYLDTKIDPKLKKEERHIEIQNIEKAITFIEREVGQKDVRIDQALICEIHRQVVDSLTPGPRGEGDATPGQYRKDEVAITGSEHKPPLHVDVNRYMLELCDFINAGDPSQYDLIKTAIVHHRFTWIHPFKNGNGRTVRLLTYAMLIKQGFNVSVGRIINPTAVFSLDRDKYNSQLALADKGTKETIMSWCEYVLSGLRDEIGKIDKLLNRKYLASNILEPTIKDAVENKMVTDDEAKVLIHASSHHAFKTGDVKKMFPKMRDTQLSKMIRCMSNKKMLVAVDGKSRFYRIKLDNKYLIKSLIMVLGEKGFLPTKD